MNIGIIIAVRMDSNRLPGKVLKKINGKETSKIIHERLVETDIEKENIIFATSEENTDDIIERFCIKNSYKYYRGAKNDVALRLLRCAKYFNFDAFIRICGDNVFADPEIINNMIQIFLNGKYEVVTNIPGRTFPYGMSVEIVQIQFFENIYKKISKDSDREHVTKYIYDHIEKYNVYSYISNEPNFENVKLALDTEEDFKIISSIFKKFKKNHTEYGIKDIVGFYYDVQKYIP